MARLIKVNTYIIDNDTIINMDHIISITKLDDDSDRCYAIVHCGDSYYTYVFSMKFSEVYRKITTNPNNTII